MTRQAVQMYNFLLEISFRFPFSSFIMMYIMLYVILTLVLFPELLTGRISWRQR